LRAEAAAKYDEEEKSLMKWNGMVERRICWSWKRRRKKLKKSW
jgi:hypothetical protein